MTNYGDKQLPREFELFELTGVSREIAPYFHDALLDPLAGVLHRPGKNFRSQLVELGFSCGNSEKSSSEKSSSDRSNAEKPSLALTRWQNLLEQMHAASLIVDDIQDNSEIRRGTDTLHKMYGMPIALNAGNWLYFWQLFQIRQLQLLPDLELEMTRLCIETYLKGHFGQAIDLGVNVLNTPQEKIRELSLANMELKTGALTAFAISSGGALAGLKPEGIRLLYAYGLALGKKLQMLDDLGNLSGKKASVKRYEDLRERRLCWPMAKASEILPTQKFEFVKKLILESQFWAVENYLEQNSVLDLAKSEALQTTENSLHALEKYFPAFPAEKFSQLEQKLEGAYA